MIRPVRVVAVLVVSTCAVALTSCAGADQEGSPAHRMSVWVSGTGLGPEIGTLVADNARIAKVVPNGSGALHARAAPSSTMPKWPIRPCRHPTPR